MFKATKFDAKYAPPLTSEHVTVEKLKKLKVALWVAYVGGPVSLVVFLCMLILDDNHPIAESIPVALTFMAGFFFALGAFLYVALSPIYRRLMNRILELDEGEIHLQHKAYAFAYGVIFKGGLFLTLFCVLLVQVLNLNMIRFSFPDVNGGGILLASMLTIVFMFLIITMLPMIYLVWNLKPVGEED